MEARERTPAEILQEQRGALAGGLHDGSRTAMDIAEFQKVLLHTFSRDQAERAEAERRLDALKVRACIWGYSPPAPRDAGPPS